MATAKLPSLETGRWVETETDLALCIWQLLHTHLPYIWGNLASSADLWQLLVFKCDVRWFYLMDALFQRKPPKHEKNELLNGVRVLHTLRSNQTRKCVVLPEPSIQWDRCKISSGDVRYIIKILFLFSWVHTSVKRRCSGCKARSSSEWSWSTSSRDLDPPHHVILIQLIMWSWST